MPVYILLSRLTDAGATTVKANPGQIKEINREIEALGAHVLHQYATLGSYDFVTIVAAPDASAIARVSVELGARGNVRIETLAALPIEEFINTIR
jgi:uncharacterized protein with GYD domain